MNLEKSLRDIIQILAKANQSASLRVIYNNALTLVRTPWWRVKRENMIQVNTFGGMKNIVGLSPAKIMEQEVYIFKNFRPDFMTIPGWYRIDSRYQEAAAITSLQQPGNTQMLQGKILKTSSQTSLQKLINAIDNVRLNAGINLVVAPTRKRVTIQTLDKLLEPYKNHSDVSTVMYLECMLGTRVIMVHQKRGNINNLPSYDFRKRQSNTDSIKYMVGAPFNKIGNKQYEDYTTMLLREMTHPFLKYVDHYHVGTSVTPSARDYVEDLDYDYRSIKNSPNKVRVSHYVMDYMEFVRSPIFDIQKKMDPNTYEGFFNNLIMSMESDDKFLQHYAEHKPAKRLYAV